VPDWAKVTVVESKGETGRTSYNDPRCFYDAFFHSQKTVV